MFFLFFFVTKLMMKSAMDDTPLPPNFDVLFASQALIATYNLDARAANELRRGLRVAF